MLFTIKKTFMNLKKLLIFHLFLCCLSLVSCMKDGNDITAKKFKGSVNYASASMNRNALKPSEQRENTLSIEKAWKDKYANKSNQAKVTNIAKPKAKAVKPVDVRIAFLDSLQIGAKMIGVPFIWYKAVTWNESSFKANSQSKKSSSCGIIGFNKATAKRLGTSCYALKRMECYQQAHYSTKYFMLGLKEKGKYRSLTDFYLQCLMPAMRDFHDKPYAVLMKRGDDYYHLNTAFDLDKNGKVQVWEVTKHITAKLEEVKKLN